jgi:hypothetical protein
VIETGSTTFNPSTLNSAAGHGQECPLLFLAHILDDIEGFVKRSRQATAKMGKTFLDLKINIGKLRKAEKLWWKCDPRNRAQPSSLKPAEQSIALVELFATAFPEQVACLADVHWYAAGLRVRGRELPTISKTGRIVLFNPREDKWVKQQSDQGQPHLNFLFCLELRDKPMRTMVIISDSTCDETGFRYGLTCVFRQAGIFVLWLVCKGGAKAKDLSMAWVKAPRADFGLTIYNCNDVMTNWLWEDAIDDDVKELYLTAQQKCACRSFFL